MNYGNKNFMICLSKNLDDEYINMYAKGAKLPIYDYDYNYQDKKDSILIRSLAKRKVIWECQRSNQNFYYMDSGYVGNYKCDVNPMGWKLYHRIVQKLAHFFGNRTYSRKANYLLRKKIVRILREDYLGASNYDLFVFLFFNDVFEQNYLWLLEIGTCNPDARSGV